MDIQEATAEINKPEKEIALTRQSSVFLIRNIVAIILFSDLIFFGLIFAADNLQGLFNSNFASDSFVVTLFLIIQTIDIILMIIVILAWMNRIYIMTTEKITFRHGIIARREHDYSITFLQNVQYHQGFLGRIFNFGNLILYSPSLSKNLIIRGIPDPKLYADTLDEYLSDKIYTK